MSTPSPNEPKIVSHNIPIIEVYQVTDDELSRMEEAATNVGNEFAIMLVAISITITLLISLMQGKFEPDVEIFFIVAVVISTLTAIIMGIQWYRHRSSVSKIISQIRSRRTEPNT